MKNLYLSLTVLVPVLFLSACGISNESLEQKAQRIHNEVLTVDTHCDTPMYLNMEGFDIGKRNNREEGGGCVDLVRMKEGGMDAMFWAVFIGQGSRDDQGNKRAKSEALEILDSIKSSIGRYPELASVCYEPGDAYSNELEGKRSIYIGMENGYPLGMDLGMVETYYDLGVRYITLCHTRNNDICDSSTDEKGPEYNGLSDFGEEVVQEMNRLGIIIDVSHISDSSFYDVLRLSKTPVIASHSCARAICDNPRNLSDEMLKDLAENGGVIQMCILSAYVKKPDPYPARDSAFAALREKYNNFESLSDEEMAQARKDWFALQRDYPQKLANVSEVVDHIDHIVEVAGIDHVGIGTDFDGGGGVEGCRDVSEMGNITLELVKRGYTQKEIEKIWSGNFMRVFQTVRSSSGL